MSQLQTLATACGPWPLYMNSDHCPQNLNNAGRQAVIATRVLPASSTGFAVFRLRVNASDHVLTSRLHTLCSATSEDKLWSHLAVCHLQTTGVVALGNLAAQFALGSDLLLSVIRPRMNKTIHGRIEGSLLYTSAYIARIKAQVCYDIISCARHARIQCVSVRRPMCCICDRSTRLVGSSQHADTGRNFLPLACVNDGDDDDNSGVLWEFAPFYATLLTAWFKPFIS